MLLMSERQKTSYEVAAEKMLADGAERVSAGETVVVRPGFEVKLLTGWGALDAEKGRLVCTGRTERVGAAARS